MAHGQVFAAFKATDTAGCAPLVIHFTNLSTGATSYTWSLGNSSTSTLTDVSTTYLAAGTYTVTLTAKNGPASKDTTMIIRAYGKPTVNFTTSDTAVCPGTAITYTSTSTANAWGDLAYTWNFGDGNGSTLGTTSYTHFVPGRYNIVLFAMNSKGCVNTKSKPGLINIFTPPVALFSTTQTYFCKYPSKDSFVNASSGKAPFTYLWSFGDGGTSTLKNSSHFFSAAGRYNVDLQTKDANGCVDHLTQYGLVGVSGFRSSFTPIANGCLNVPLRFENTSPPSYTMEQWDFGDGSPVSDSPTHTYVLNGTYPVRLVVYNDTCYDTIVHNITISRPSGSIIATQQCSPTSSMTFTASTVPGIKAYWDFGDGNTDTGIVRNHRYLNLDTVEPKVRPVTLVLTNSVGCTDTTILIDTIKNHFVSASLTSTSLKGCAPLTSSFKAAGRYVIKNPVPPNPPCLGLLCDSLNLPYPSPITTYKWNFGDGSPISTSVNPSHTYSAAGVYTASVSVTYANGCADDSIVIIHVGTTPPASFVFTGSVTTPPHSHVCGSDSMFAKSTSTFPLIDEYFWIQGIPTPPYTGADVLPFTSFRPDKAGPSIPFSLVTGYNGCYSTPYTLNYTVDSAVAKMGFTYLCIPNNGVKFTDLTDGVTSRKWILSDGTTDTSATFIHYFPSLAIYTASLTTENSRAACRDTAGNVIDLNRLAPAITPIKSAICLNLTDTFAGSTKSTLLNPVTLYKWYLNNTLLASHTTAYPKDSAWSNMRIKGDNNVTLIVTDSHGCFDTASTIVTVAKPKASFTISTLDACPKSGIIFTDHSTDVTGVGLSTFTWSFGDHSAAITTTPSVTHSYDFTGSYTNIREIVTDTVGCKDTLTVAAGPNIHSPTAKGSLLTSSTCVGVEVFSNNPTNDGSPADPATNFLWMLGDGATSTLSQPSHTYNTADTYTVTLVAYDRFGCTDTLSLPKAITVNANPIAGFYMDDSFAVCPPITVDFINTSTGATTYRWDLGDHTGSTSIYPTDIYTDTGLYKIHMTVYNDAGCRDDAYGNVSIFGYAGAFGYTPEKLCASAPVTFTAPTSKIIKSIWDYNDGTPVDSITTGGVNIHRYAPGAYVPVLTLVGVSGCRKSSVGTDTIKVDTIMADFNGTPDPVCQNKPIALHDRSTPTYSAAKTWSWSFGGGATSTLANPSYTYTVSGAQPITLTVTDTLGCSSTTIKTVSVTPGPSNISGTPIVCIGQPATLSDALPGGTWTSSNTTIVTVGSTNGTITGARAGTATITYTLSSGCATTLSASVNTLPGNISGIMRVCATYSTTLSSSPTGGTWSSANTGIASVGSTGVVSGINPGTVVISYTLPSGCASTSIVTIDTMPAPMTNIAICAGDNTTLSNAVAGGTWTSSATTVATVGVSSGILSAISAGTTTITYGFATGCNAARTVSVNALSPISGLPSVCAGMELSLTITNTSGSWSSGNTAVAIVGTTGMVTGIAQGTATITYTNPSGCVSTKTVTVNPVPPAIAGVMNICAGAVATLSDAGGGTWSISGTAAGIDPTTGDVTGVSAGTALVTYTTGLGCIATAMITISPLPPPVSGAKNLCIGQPATLSDALTGGTWNSADTTVSVFALTGVVTGLYTGTATITYTPASGCAIMDTIAINPMPDTIAGLLIVCPSATTTLSETIYGAWSSGDTAIAIIDAVTGVATGVSSGTADITFTSAAGCMANTTLTVLPVISPISGPAALCPEAVITLSDDIKGGTWRSSDTTVASVSSSGALTARSVGTTTISYSAANTCDTATLTIKINPLPRAGTITGDKRICAYSQTTLNDTIAGGVWTSGNPLVAMAGSTGVVSGVAAGTATISYTYINSCGSAAATAVVIIDPVPPHARIVIHPDTVLCANTLFQNFGADAPEPTGVHYTWTAVNATVYAAKGQYALISFNNPGTAMVKLSTGQDTTQCGSADSIAFHMSEERSPDGTVIYYAPEFVCRDNSANGYQWGYDDVFTLDSTLIAGAVNQSYYNETPELAKKNYWVLTYHNGCMQKLYYNAPVSVHDNQASIAGIVLYPNPADNTINIKIAGANKADITKAELTDALGRKIKIMDINGTTGAMTLDNLAPGAYMILFSRNGTRIEQRTFIKH